MLFFFRKGGPHEQGDRPTRVYENLGLRTEPAGITCLMTEGAHSNDTAVKCQEKQCTTD